MYICKQKEKKYIDRLGNMGGKFLVVYAIDLIMISLPDSYIQFVTNFHMKNLKVTLIELSDMLGDKEADIIVRKTQSRSKDIETGNVYEQKMISLLKENEKVMTEVFNQGLKRKVNIETSLIYDSVEAYFPCCQEKGYLIRSYREYLKDFEYEMVQTTKLYSCFYKNISC